MNRGPGRRWRWRRHDGDGVPWVPVRRGRAGIRGQRSALRQLQLDAAVARIGLVGGAEVERLELAEARRDEALRRDALARPGTAPPRWRGPPRAPSSTGTARVAIGRVSVWPSTRSTQGMSGGICAFELDQRGWRCGRVRPRPPARRVGLAAPGRAPPTGSTKRSPTMRMSGPVAEDLAQAAEEVGAVARQLLHPLGQRDVEAAAEIGDARLALAVARSPRRERLLQGRELAAHGGDLLVEELDLAHGARPVACRSASSAVLSSAGRRLRRRRRRSIRPWRRRALGLRAPASVRLQARRGCPRRSRRPERSSASRSVSSEIWRLSRSSTVSRPDDLPRQEELAEHEDREQEDDGEQQRRERVDEARPVIELAAVAPRRAAPAAGHGIRAACSRDRRSSTCFSSFSRAACASTQSRIICCSARMCWTRPWMPSARLAMACVAARPPAPSVHGGGEAGRARGELGRGRRQVPGAAAASAPVVSCVDGARASPRARCRSGSGPGRPAGRGSRATSEPARPKSEAEKDEAHAGERRGEAALQLVEQHAGVAAGAQRAR